MTKTNLFDARTVELNGSNLIEASAGTGKTYSIAILVLRLIIEKGIPIEKILMVTFTKAAVAELETRIRKFVRKAYRYACGSEIDEKSIKDVVGKPNKNKINSLQNALQSLDSLSVLTIHSFCQKTIDEFTFETDQSFDYEIITDDSVLLKDASNRYFREVLNVLELKKFSELLKKLKTNKMPDLLRKHLSGMKFIDSHIEVGTTYDELEKQVSKTKDEFDRFIKDKFIQIRALPIKHNALLTEAENNNVEGFKRRFRDQIKKPAAYFSTYEFMVSDFQKYENEVKFAENELFNYFYLDFIRRAEHEIGKIKQKNGYISYDDQIKTIHSALHNDQFKEKLAKQYQAVFIDEFQDTDKHQYEIFNTVFSDNSILFYIGDPKQSIYGWRSADLDTYKLAKESVGSAVFSMNTNYRSTKKIVDALNILMNPDERFNMFEDDEIRYVNVEQGASEIGEMTDHGHEVLPVTLWEFDPDDNETNHSAVCQEILRLLTEEVKIKERKILPKDIGVLVRDRKEGSKIKELLARLNIPAVSRDDTKVLNTGESELIINLIKAIISPKRGDINRALCTHYFGFTTDAIKSLDEEEQIEIFLGLRKTLTEEGIYNMISSFLDIYGVREICINDVLGQRVLTNIIQIAEILHKTEKKNKYSPEELLVWLKRSSDDDNDELQQRIESDEDAVQISTIHKAKGLEYNIVFAPFLSMIPKKKLLESGIVNDFKKGGEYCFTLNYDWLSREDKECFDRQKEQENKRLIYVTLTRAVYKCYISLVPRNYGRGKSKKIVPSSLSTILDQYQKSSPLIEYKCLPKADFEIIHGQYQPQHIQSEFTPREKPQIEIKNTFGIHSFSGLSKAHYTAPFEKVQLGEPDDYDQFIFQELRRGANVGNALHSIFEWLNFAEPDSWNQTLMEASKYYSNIIKEENLLPFKQLVENVMRVSIHCNGVELKLSELKNEQKLPELEFYFSMDKVNKTIINEFLGEEAYLGGEADLEGLMMGFIDLLFEHEGKYYILDWKSNHLGNSVEHYTRAGMEEAMSGSNYHLQYVIYTVAAKRWLTNKIAGFDYDQHFGGIIYVFLRGVRQGMDTGIYAIRPEKEVIERLDVALKS